MNDNVPNKKEIEDVIAEAMSEKDKFPGMTYADGVETSLDWVLGNVEYPPMEE